MSHVFAPRISKLTQRYPAAANKHESIFIRPIALACAMSVNIDIRGEGVRPTLKTSRMSVYLSDTGRNNGSVDKKSASKSLKMRNHVIRIGCIANMS